MHRVYCPHDFSEQIITLKDPDEVFHLSRVIRLKPDDLLILVNGQGALVKARLLEVTKSTAQFSLEEAVYVEEPTARQITLACAIPKKAKFEIIIEKCTELGVTRIIPLVTQRTEVNISDEKNEKKRERYFRVAVNAFKQSKRLWLPIISSPVYFGPLLKDLSTQEAAIFIPWLEGARMSIMKAFQEKQQKTNFVFLIGPEGDFSKEEVKQAIDIGALPLSLGKTTLKVDTAAALVVGIASNYFEN